MALCTVVVADHPEVFCLAYLHDERDMRSDQARGIMAISG
jgi:hypothetical protein